MTKFEYKYGKNIYSDFKTPVISKRYRIGLLYFILLFLQNVQQFVKGAWVGPFKIKLRIFTVASTTVIALDIPMKVYREQNIQKLKF